MIYHYVLKYKDRFGINMDIKSVFTFPDSVTCQNIHCASEQSVKPTSITGLANTTDPTQSTQPTSPRPLLHRPTFEKPPLLSGASAWYLLPAVTFAPPPLNAPVFVVAAAYPELVMCVVADASPLSNSSEFIYLLPSLASLRLSAHEIERGCYASRS